MKFSRCLLPGVFAVLLAIPASAAGDLKMDKTTGCRIQPPSTWQGYTVQWAGACVKGLADGVGVLKGLQKGKPLEFFYGRVAKGVLVVGVIDVGGGYMAGKFADGKPVESEDRNATIHAFDEAVAGAKAASQFYQQKGNAASAQYYAEKAKALGEAID